MTRLIDHLKAATGPSRRWSVEHRDGLCATKTGMRPAENAASVPTLCGQFVILPIDYSQDEPDCPECIASLIARGVE
jgi:hypothetical protein